MSNDLSQAVFFGLLIETILAIVALRYPDKRKQVVILMVCTAIVGGILYGPRTLALINPPPEPTRTSTPSTLTNPITHIYDDFSNPVNDGGIDNSRWSVSGDCNYLQKDGFLLIGHEPSSESFSGCFFSGPFEGVGGNKIRLFESKFLVQNDFQGVCCSGISLTVESEAFSGGGGYFQCALHAGPGWLAGIFTINTDGGNTEEYRAEVRTTYNDWHTLRLEINPDDYKVSCFLDDSLLGSTIPKDAAKLYEATFSRYIQTGWPNETSDSFQIDDVKMIP
jgi:hypothetical protein